VFADWKQDTPELLDKLFKHDWDNMQVDKFVKIPEELQKIRTSILMNLSMLKELFVWLQAKSERYPKLEVSTVKRLLIDHLGFDKKSKTLAQLSKICLGVCD